MKKDADNTDVKQSRDRPEGPLAGERLAAARREKQITVAEVAKELHLDDPKVRALEQNQFEALGAPVFAKGHLRKYAKLVGVSLEEVLGDYYTLNRTTGMPPVVGKVRKSAREFTPGPWIAVIAVLFIVTIAYWWFVGREAPVSAQAVPDAAVELPSDEAELPAPVDNAKPAVTDRETDESAREFVEPTADNASDVVSPQAAEQVRAVPETSLPPLPAGEVRLVLSYSGDCWTEVTDAGGRRLFFDLGHDGRTASVSGRAPLSVLFGNADNVLVTVNGSDYDISPSDRRGKTARLTIAAP